MRKCLLRKPIMQRDPSLAPVLGKREINGLAVAAKLERVEFLKGAAVRSQRVIGETPTTAADR